MPRVRTRKTALLALATVVVTLAVVEIGARLAIPAIEKYRWFRFTPIAERLEQQQNQLRPLLAGTHGHLRLDPELGWTQRDDYVAETWSSNAQGVRGRRLYDEVPPPGVLRVAAFGDSFVHAHEVRDEEAWSARVEALDPDVEVPNYGVGGYGVDQALLRYRSSGGSLRPHVVVLGFTEAMARRNVNRYRPFRVAGELPLFKPRFVLDESGALRLVPSAFAGDELHAVLADPRRVLEAGVGDAFYEPWEWENPLYDHVAAVRLFATLFARVGKAVLSEDRAYRDNQLNPESSSFALLEALVRQFAREVESSGREFLFLVFPVKDSDIFREGPRSYEPLLEALSDLDVLDLAVPLAASGIEPRELRANGGHYSARANEVVARAVLRALGRESGESEGR